MGPFIDGHILALRCYLPGNKNTAMKKYYIRIIAAPSGEAPEEIRRAWVGVRIPLPPFHRKAKEYFTAGVLTGLTPGGSDRKKGYVVSRVDAIEALEKINPQTAKWWRENASHDSWTGKFVYSAESCALETDNVAIGEWFRGLMPSRKAEPDAENVHKVNIFVQIIFGLVSFVIAAYVTMLLMAAGKGHQVAMVCFLIILLLPVASLLFAKNLLSVWAHLTLQFILWVGSCTIVAVDEPFFKWWIGLHWDVSRFVYDFTVTVVALSISTCLGEYVLRVRCPIKSCHGWCRRQSTYPATFVCGSCGKKYITSIYFEFRR